MDEELKKPKKHRLMNRPYLAFVLLTVISIVITTISGWIFMLFGPSEYREASNGIGNAVGALLCLLIFRLMFRKEYNGALKIKGFGKGLLLLSPALVLTAINVFDLDFASLTGKRILIALFCGMGPGVSEEVAFRGLSGANFLRRWRDEKKIFTAALATSLLFGCIHLTNILGGAGVIVSITQVIYACGIGMLFAAVYFRTGSLLPAILLHTLTDFTAFLNEEVAASGGVLTDQGFDPGYILLAVLGLAVGALGIYYIRPSKRAEIRALWDEKWKLPPEAPEETDEDSREEAEEAPV